MVMGDMGRKSVYIMSLMCLVVSLTNCCSGLNNSDDNISENIEMQSKGGEYTNKEVENHRGKGSDKNQNNGGIVEKVLPLLIIPFLVSSAIIPIMLKSIKILMVKSFIVGKIAVILMLLNFFRRRSERGGVYNHYVDNIAEGHYGYKGIEEPGVYVQKRRRRRKLRHIL